MAAASAASAAAAGRGAVVPGKRECMALLGVLLAVAALAGPAAAAEYKVGDAIGWTIMGSPNYTAWALSKTFRVGDTIVFEYNNNFHNVLEVSRSNYDGCNAANPISTHTTGKDSIALKTAGHHYFICGIPTHCSLSGQKVDVNVLSSSSPSTPAPAPASSTNSAPAPASSSPPAAPSVPSPASGAPPALTNGSESNSSQEKKSASSTSKQVLLPVVGAVLATVVLGWICWFLWWRLRWRGRKMTTERVLRKNGDVVVAGSGTGAAMEDLDDLPLMDFTSIAAATDGFSAENKLGEGGFGPVYVVNF